MPRETPPDLSDTLCEACGYRLNGLPENGNCPECGQPVADSTIASPRRDPMWETSPRTGLFHTLKQVLLRPNHFFRTLALHEQTPQSRKLGIICIAVAAWMNMKTIAVHYFITIYLSVAPDWLLPLWVLPIVVLVLSFLAWWGVIQLVGYLTTLEGAFWGMRLPRPIVKRVLQYWSVHVAGTSIVMAFIPIIFLLILVSDRDAGLHMVKYLYVLSGAVIVAAIYLFRIYWIAMKAIMFGNPSQPAIKSDVADALPA